MLEESATPDVQCSIAPGSFKDGQIGELDDFPGLTAGAWQMRPLSRGYVEARSPNPAEAPAINPRYLSDPTDRRAIVGGLRFVRRLFAAPALARYCGSEIQPGAAAASMTANRPAEKRVTFAQVKLGSAAIRAPPDQARSQVAATELRLQRAASTTQEDAHARKECCPG